VSQETLDSIVILVGVLAASAFVIGLHYMNSPATARMGNRISAVGMTVAVIVTFLSLLLREGLSTEGLIIIAAGLVIGGAVGLVMALRVAMTAMPQLVSLFNAVGGGAAAIGPLRTAAAPKKSLAIFGCRGGQRQYPLWSARRLGQAQASSAGPSEVGGS
jgi:NAD(P) transhydrogenase subunit beta